MRHDKSILVAPNARHWFMLITLVILWGSSFAINKTAVETISAIWVASLRLSIGAIVMVLILYHRGHKLSFSIVHWLWFAWLGAVGFAAPFTLIAWGTIHISSGIAGILMATVPLSVIVIGYFILPDEQITYRKAIGFFTGFTGTMLLIGVTISSQASHNETSQLWPILGVTIAAICYAINGTTARLMPEISNTQKATGVLIAASLITLPIAITLEPKGLSEASFQSWISVLALGLLPTAFATVILFLLLKEVGVTFVALSNYLVPVWALLIGVLGLKETLIWSDWIGFCLIFCGIFVADPARAKKTKKPA